MPPTSGPTDQGAPRHPIDEDSALVVAVQAGDVGAYEELFRRHHKSVKRVCARRLGDQVEADEVAQATFVRALERIDRCIGDRRFGAWVQVIAQRLCVDMIRARNRTVPDDDPLRDERPALNVVIDLDAGTVTEEALVRRERTERVQEAIALLPDRQREVVVARHLEGRRPPEIAAALGLSVGAVDSLLLRARRRLATNYEHVLAEGAPVAPTAAVAPTVTTSGAVVASVGHSGPMAGLPHAVGGIVREAVVALPQAPSVLPAPVRRAVATLAAMAVAPVLSTLPAPSSTLPGPAGPPAALSAPPAGTFPTMAAAPPQPIDRALPVAPETLVPAAAGSAAGLASSLLEAAAAPVLPTGAATAATAALDPPGPGGRPTPLPLPVPVPVPVPVPEAAGLPAGSGPGGAPALPTVPSLPPVPAVPALPAIPVPSTGTAPAVPALPLPALPLPLPTQPLVPVPAPAPPSSPPG